MKEETLYLEVIRKKRIRVGTILKDVVTEWLVMDFSLHTESNKLKGVLLYNKELEFFTYVNATELSRMIVTGYETIEDKKAEENYKRFMSYLKNVSQLEVGDVFSEGKTKYYILHIGRDLYSCTYVRIPKGRTLDNSLLADIKYINDSTRMFLTYKIGTDKVRVLKYLMMRK